mgnify:CR=1 FL=1
MPIRKVPVEQSCGLLLQVNQLEFALRKSALECFALPMQPKVHAVQGNEALRPPIVETHQVITTRYRLQSGNAPGGQEWLTNSKLAQLPVSAVIMGIIVAHLVMAMSGVGLYDVVDSCFGMPFDGLSDWGGTFQAISVRRNPRAATGVAVAAAE